LSKIPQKWFGNIIQVGVVVKDIKKTCQNLVEIFGIGPLEIQEWPPREDMQRWYYNKPATFTAWMAFCVIGNVELEIIQPRDGKSIWSDFLEKKEEGIHHIRFNVENDEEVEKYLSTEYGIRSIQHGDGIRTGTKWMNFDTGDLVGFVIEIMRVVPGTDGLTPRENKE
jgi:methylmalonyl-CoA/ethylmalonyl-CoA epimerase